MKLDFYIPSLNIDIECQGGQHFYSKIFFGGNEGFEKTKLRDTKKHELCKEHNIDIIYFCEEKDRKQIPFGNNVYSEENVVFSIEELCNKIGI